MVTTTVPHSLHTVGEGETLRPTLRQSRTQVASYAIIAAAATPALTPLADVVVATDEEFDRLLNEILGEDDQLWRRLANL